MKTREELVETALEALYDVRAWEPDDSSDVFHKQAVAVVNALLPRVTTAAELELMPTGSKLLGEDGAIWEVLPTPPDPETYARALQAGPLTILWEPDR